MTRSFESRREAGGGASRSRHAASRPVRPRTAGLPAQLTPLVGREREIEEVSALLLDGAARLLTLTGPAGIGKTRLAVAVATSLAGRRPSGVAFVDLSSLADPARVPSAVARALGLPEAADRPLAERLLDELRERPLLLLLDNFEGVLPAAPLVGEWLAASPDLVVLVTSRAPLQVYGEQEFGVPPLALPSVGSREQGTGNGADSTVTPQLAARGESDSYVQYASVRLFVERARAVARDFALTDENVAAVVELCVRLDGLPLALELAAAQCRLLAPAALLERLDVDALQESRLGGAAHGRPGRHQTLRAAIDSSYRLLDEKSGALFRRLAVFAGGFTVEAAAAVDAGGAAPHQPEAGGEPDATLGALNALVNMSLVQVSRTPAGDPRFGLLETVRAFALEELRASGELDEARARHAAHFVALAQRSSRAGPRQSEWLGALDRDHDNLRAALRWAVNALDASLVTRMVNALWWFWSRRGHLAEGRQWVEAALTLTADDQASAGTEAAAELGQWRATTLISAGALAWYQGDHATAEAWLNDGLDRCRAAGDRSGAAQALMFLGLVLLRRAELVASRHCFEESVALRRALGDRWGTAMSLTCFAGVPISEGDYEGTLRLEAESAALFREVGDRWALTIPLFGLGMIAYYRGDYPAAQVHLEEALAIRREVGDTWSTAQTLYSLGLVARACADHPRALALFKEALDAPQALGNVFAVAQYLSGAAGALVELGLPTAAARLLGAAQTAFDGVPSRLHPVERAQVEHDIEAVHAALGDQAFLLAWASGRALPFARAVQEALGIQPGARTTRAVPGDGAPAAALTRREREVAALIARGFTNRQIAAALTITEGTAGSHVEHILGKLGYGSRAQVAAWAVAAGLIDGAA